MPRSRVAATLVLSTVGVALAAAPAAHGTATIATKFTGSNKVGPKGVALRTVLENKRTDGRKPATTRQLDLFLPKQLRTNGRRFPACTLQTLNDPNRGPEACPRNSQIGTGSAKGQISNPTPASGSTPAQPATFEELSVRAYNGPSGKSINFFLSGTTPATINKAIEGRLSAVKNSASFGQRLRTTIPADLQQPVPGLFVPLTEFTVTINKKVRVRRKRVPYLRIKSCPTNRRLAFRAIFKFNPNSGGGSYQIPTADEVANATAICRKR